MRLVRSLASRRPRSSRDSSNSVSSSAIRSSVRHWSAARERVSSATRRPAARSQARMSTEPVTQAAAAAAANALSTVGWSKSQAPPAQMTETPATADGWRSRCSGGE